MKHDPIRPGKRRPVNISIDENTIDAARGLGINVSQTCQRALDAEVKAARDLRWKEENAEWIAAHSRWVDANELPLERYRLF